MCEIVGKRFIKFWAHPDCIYRWTGLYKIQAKHCDIIDKLTGRVRTKCVLWPFIWIFSSFSPFYRSAMRREKSTLPTIKIKSPNSCTQSTRIRVNHINRLRYWSINSFVCFMLGNSANKWWKSKSRRSLLQATKRRHSPYRIRFYCWQCTRISRIDCSKSCKVCTIRPMNIHRTNAYSNWVTWTVCWRRACECFPLHHSLYDAASPTPNWVRARFPRMLSSWWVYSTCTDAKIFGVPMRMNSIRTIFRRNNLLDGIRSVSFHSAVDHEIA